MRLLLGACLLLVSTPVLAQSESSNLPEGSNTDSAESSDANDSELFNAGLAAIADQRFADASDYLRRALDLSPRTATAFNLVIALRGTGEVSEAVRVLEALRAGDYGRLEEAQLAQIDSLRRELTPELAQLRVRAESARLRIDTEEHVTGEWVRLDPGAHVVEAEAEGFQPLVRRVELSAGDRRTLDLALEPIPETTVERPSRAWVWVLAGVVVAGGVALAVGLSVRPEPEPLRDPVFGNTEALSW